MTDVLVFALFFERARSSSKELARLFFVTSEDCSMSFAIKPAEAGLLCTVLISRYAAVYCIFFFLKKAGLVCGKYL